ncbi:MAG: FecR domain-containing protein [Rhodothermales bacterium]|nr:FecR domain-containing protein [Rhodothermales bacterium]
MNEHDEALILRSLDTELSPDQAARLDDLLRTSPDAALLHRQHQWLREAIHAGGAATFSNTFTDDVLRRVAEAKAPTLRLVFPLHSYQMLALAASVVLLVISGLLWWTTLRTIEALPGERLVAHLPDGSTVELNSASSLTYRPFLGRLSRTVRLDGEGFFSVASDGSPFVVETHNARVQVLGTRFNVSTRPALDARETRVAVEEGRVFVQALVPDDAGVTLDAAQETVVHADTTRPKRPTTVALDLTLAWRSGGLAFQGLPLRLATDELGRRYGRTIAVERTLGEVSVGYIQPSPQSLESVLTDICASVNLAYRRTANGYEIYRP